VFLSTLLKRSASVGAKTLHSQRIKRPMAPTYTHRLTFGNIALSSKVFGLILGEEWSVFKHTPEAKRKRGRKNTPFLSLTLKYKFAF